MGGSASNALTADEAREVGRRLGSRYVVTGKSAADRRRRPAHRRGAGRRERRDARRRPGDRAGRQRVVAGGRADAGAPAWQRPADRWRVLATQPEPGDDVVAPRAQGVSGRRARIPNRAVEDAVRHYQQCHRGGLEFRLCLVPPEQRVWLVGGCPDRARGELLQTSPGARGSASRTATRSGSGRSELNVEALEALTATYPDDIEAWVALGESYYHHRRRHPASDRSVPGRVHSGGAALSLLRRGLRAPDRGRVSASRQSRRPTPHRWQRRTRGPPSLQ